MNVWNFSTISQCSQFFSELRASILADFDTDTEMQVQILTGPWMKTSYTSSKNQIEGIPVIQILLKNQEFSLGMLTRSLTVLIVLAMSLLN